MYEWAAGQTDTKSEIVIKITLVCKESIYILVQLLCAYLVFLLIVDEIFDF